MRSAAPGAPANAPPLRVHLSTTFLADLLLFPANSVDEWPCLELFADSDAYLRAVLHSRTALRRLTGRHPPALAICDGKSHWDDRPRPARQIFRVNELKYEASPSAASDGARGHRRHLAPAGL